MSSDCVDLSNRSAEFLGQSDKKLFRPDHANRWEGDAKRQAAENSEARRGRPSDPYFVVLRAPPLQRGNANRKRSRAHERKGRRFRHGTRPRWETCAVSLFDLAVVVAAIFLRCLCC